MSVADRVELPDRRLPRLGQIQGVGAAIAGDLAAHNQFAPLEFIDKLHEIRSLDPERLCDRRLRRSGIAIDRRQDAILGRANIVLGKGANEIVEDRKLGAPQLVADDVDQRGQIDRRAGVGF